MRESFAFGWAVGSLLLLVAGVAIVSVVPTRLAFRAGGLVARWRLGVRLGRGVFVVATVFTPIVATALTLGWPTGVAGACVLGSWTLGVIAVVGPERPMLGVLVASGVVAGWITAIPNVVAPAAVAGLVANLVIAGLVVRDGGGTAARWSRARQARSARRTLRCNVERAIDPNILSDADLAWWAAAIGWDDGGTRVVVPGRGGRLTGSIRPDGRQLLVLLTPSGRVAGTSALLRSDPTAEHRDGAVDHDRPPGPGPAA